MVEAAQQELKMKQNTTSAEENQHEGEEEEQNEIDPEIRDLEWIQVGLNLAT